MVFHPVALDLLLARGISPSACPVVFHSVALDLFLARNVAPAPSACVRVRSRSPLESAHSSRIFVTKTASDINVCAVEDHFALFGVIRKVKILSPAHEGGRVVVTFQRSRSARSAMQADRHCIGGRNVKVVMARHR